MKKQINPTIKAHLIRSGFYVLLLLAVCVIPFALAQQRTNKSAIRPAPAQPQTQLLPYDLRPAPAQVGQRISQFPLRSSGPAGVRHLGILPHPRLPEVVLYDQYDNAAATSTSSQNFEPANDPFDSFTADDFVVPSGETWNIEEVDVLGAYFNGLGPADSF